MMQLYLVLFLYSLMTLVKSRVPIALDTDFFSCGTMEPKNFESGPMKNPPKFSIDVTKKIYYRNDIIKVTINGDEGFHFKHFMIQARRADSRLDQSVPIGSFKKSDSTQNVCSVTTGSAVINMDDSWKNEVTLEWQAPSRSNGHIKFSVTVWATPMVYWLAEESIVVTDPKSDPLPVVDDEKDNSKTPGVSRISLVECGVSKGCYRNPPKCPEKSCDAIVTWKDMGSDILFELSADTKGWVGIGFSHDTLIGDDSVTECVWNPSEGVMDIQHSFNVDEVNNTPNPEKEVGLSEKKGKMSNGRVRCSFKRAKKIATIDKIYDLGEAYHLILAQGKIDKNGEKKRHSLEPYKFPMVSPPKVEFSEFSDISGRARYPLFKIYIILMLIGWMMAANVAVIMAKYYQPMWPNDRSCGRKIWFSTHRACFSICLICTLLAVVIFFVHQGGWVHYPDYPIRAHLPLLITVVILSILLLLIVLCRPNSKSSRRPIFNWFYWLFGTAAHVLSVPTIFIAISMYKAFVPWWATWILVAFFLFHVIIELLLEIHGCINARKQKQRTMEHELRKKTEPAAELDGYLPDPVGTRFKKIIITLYLVVMLVLGIVMIITVAAG